MNGRSAITPHKKINKILMEYAENVKKSNTKPEHDTKKLELLARHNIEYAIQAIRDINPPKTPYKDIIGLVKEYIEALRKNPESRPGPSSLKITHEYHIRYAARVLANRNESSFSDALNSAEEIVDLLLQAEEDRKKT